MPPRRAPTARIRGDLADLGAQCDESLYPLPGYHVGLLAGRDIPVICGLELAAPTHDDLRALGAAFATTSSAPMFHLAGVTPEAPDAHARTIMTNSGKYAHYAPGLLGRKTCFGSLRDCVEGACTGQVPRRMPAWLVEAGP